MKTLRTWLGRLGLLIGGTLLALLLTELGLRLRSGALGMEFLLANTPELYDTSIFQADRETVVSLKPGARAHIRTAEYDQEVRVSAQGLRGADLGPRAQGTLRILAVGDSFTLGMQVPQEQTFAGRLGPALSAALGQPVEVGNAGVDSQGTPHETRMARRLAPLIEARVVLLTFFTGNDFFDNADYAQAVRHPPSFLSRPETPWRWLTRRSVLAMNLQVLSHAFDLNGAGNGERHRQELRIFTEPDSLTQQVARTRPHLRAFGKTCEELGLRCYVAVAPPAFVVYEARRAASFRLFGLDPEAVIPDAPAQAVLKALPKGVAGLDLAPALRAAAGRGPLYFTLDGHWTAEGHAVVAEALAQWMGPLLEQGRADPEER